MGPSSFESVHRSVKRGEIAPIYYLTGDADVLKDELVALIVDAALESAARDFTLDTRAAGDLDPAALHTLVETLPILAERRVVVIKALEQWRKGARTWDALRRYVARPSPTTVLILVHGAGEPPDAGLVRAGTHVAVAVPGPDALRRWVTARARRAGIEMEAEAIEHLVRAVGPDLGHLGTEVEKLAAAVGDGRPVTPAEVAQLVGVNRGETIEDWVDAVAARDVLRALRLADGVLPQAGVTAVRMLIALGTELVGIRLARALAAGGLVGARLERALLEQLRRVRPVGGRNWEAQARSWASAVQHWTPDELDQAIRATYQADRALKSTTVSDDRATLRSLLLSLGAGKAAA
ncbi:MAG: DNA polymerase III subunit delta [Gemmatimonadetes bacterium]|nr:DNA polymerase III subunit delta [Gemmatimonadota bacterium]